MEEFRLVFPDDYSTRTLVPQETEVVVTDEVKGIIDAIREKSKNGH